MQFICVAGPLKNSIFITGKGMPMLQTLATRLCSGRACESGQVLRSPFFIVKTYLRKGEKYWTECGEGIKE